VWRGGGVVFGPKPRTFHQKVNRKMRRKALFGVIAAKMRDGSVRVIDDWTMDAPRTKTIVGLKNTLDTRKMLCIGTLENRNAYLSARNLTDVLFLDIDSINIYDLANATEIVVSEAAMNIIEERFRTIKQYAGTR
jgi:large subunit ribosomal protein L4